jgi:hypothetical protein
MKIAKIFFPFKRQPVTRTMWSSKVSIPDLKASTSKKKPPNQPGLSRYLKILEGPS